MIYFTYDQKVRYNIINRTDGGGGGRKGIKTEEVSLQPPCTPPGYFIKRKSLLGNISYEATDRPLVTFSYEVTRNAG